MDIFDIGLVNTAAVSSSADNKDSGSVVVLLYMSVSELSIRWY
jgi:hypothetical protein